LRISTNPDDEGFHPLVAKSDYFQIYLDGVNITNKYLLHTVDEDENWIGIYVTNKNKIAIDEYGEPITDVIHGEVRIKFKNGKENV
jgi:hypothetical protein